MSFPKYNTPGYLKAPLHLTNTVTNTGDTNENIIFNDSTNLVGALTVEDVVFFYALLSGSNTASLKNVKIYISDSKTVLLNEVLIVNWQFSSGVSSPRIHDKIFALKSSLTENKYFTNVAVNVYTPQGTFEDNGLIDLSTGEKYLIVTAQVGSAVDSLTTYLMTSKILRK